MTAFLLVYYYGFMVCVSFSLNQPLGRFCPFLALVLVLLSTHLERFRVSLLDAFFVLFYLLFLKFHCKEGSLQEVLRFCFKVILKSQVLICDRKINNRYDNSIDLKFYYNFQNILTQNIWRQTNKLKIYD